MALVKIVLKCGDQVTARNTPLNNKSKYSCVAGKGHSYNQLWTSYTRMGSSVVCENPLPNDREETPDGSANG